MSSPSVPPSSWLVREVERRFRMYGMWEELMNMSREGLSKLLSAIVLLKSSGSKCMISSSRAILPTMMSSFLTRCSKHSGRLPVRSLTCVCVCVCVCGGRGVCVICGAPA